MKSIVLIGFATSGKTTVGKMLADKLNCQFVDCDQLLAQTHGKSIEQLFEGGESNFRQLENNLIATLPLANTVIACGGGAVETPNFNYLAQNCTVVYLDIDVFTCMLRLGETKRPLHDGKTATELADFLCRRAPMYKKYADVVVDANFNPSKVLQEILAKLGL